MTVVVTGAIGRFGRHAVEALLRRGVPADRIVATGRQIDKIADADRGAAQGHLQVAGDDLETLMGRPATPIADVIRAALAG